MSRAKNLLLLVGVTALCLVLAEGVLSLALPERESAWAGVPPLEERVTAVTPKAEGEYRVLALGDSFTEYADDRGANWARVLERKARAEGRALTLVNFGQMGTGLPHYQKNLEDFGAEVEPDLVVIGLYLGNDVLDYTLALEKEARGLEVSPPKTLGRRPSGALAWLQEHSTLVGLLARALDAWRPGPTTFEQNLAHAGAIYGIDDDELARRVAAHDPAVVELAEREAINPWDLAFGLVTPSRYADLLALKGTSRVPAALERLLADVEKTEATCDRLGATCAWVLLPVGLQIDERYHAYFRDVGFETAAWMAEPTPLVAALLPALRAKGAFVVDVLPALQGARERALLLPHDTHLSDEGQRVVGEAVFRALSDAGAFSPAAPDDDAPDAERLDPRVEALLAGTALERASPEEKRLALKIAALRKLRGELQTFLTSLPAQKAEAEKIQAEIVTLEQRLPSEALKRALEDASARLQREGPGEGTLLARGPGIEAELGRLLEKDPILASDDETVKALKEQVRKEQGATAALGKGASVAFRALRTIEEMKLALPRLRELDAKGR